MSSFTIGKKLFLGVGTLVVFTFALGATALYSISTIGNRVNMIISSTVKTQTLAHELDKQASDLGSLIRAIEIRGYMKDAVAMETYNQQFTVTADAMQANVNSIVTLITNPEAKLAAEDLQQNLGAMRQAGQTVIRDSMEGHMETAVAAAVSQLLPVQKRTGADTARILKVQEDMLTAAGVETGAAISSSRWITGLMLALSCCVGLTLIIVVRQIIALLRHSVAELSEASAQIASAANQVASSSQSLAQGASEQTATIEETSSASAEIDSMAHRNTENSRTTAEMVIRSQEGFEKANQSLTEMVVAMDGINASSQKISKIIKVIDEIAFQTNILALNAAVEAARAGEAGMGFAVVADEVRNLAQRCAQAAKDTADLIEESIHRSDGGRVKVDHVAVAIREITAESSKIRVLVDEISLGSVEQSSGIDQISRAITQMEEVTQSSAAAAEQSAAAAEQLNAQAEQMKEVVGAMKAMVDGVDVTRRVAEVRSRGRDTSASAQWSPM